MRILGPSVLAMFAAIAGFAADTPPKDSLAAEVQSVCLAGDRAIRTFALESQVEQLIPTHGVYAEGFGVVLLSDMNLVALSPLFGFAGPPSKEDIAKIHNAKLKKLTVVQDLLFGVLLSASKSLTHLAPDETILINVGLYNMEFEDRSGLPRAITLQAKKKDLLAAAAARTSRADAAPVLKTHIE